MKRTALFIVLAVVMLLGLGISASAYTPGSNEVMVFGPDENRNIFHPDYGVDHSYDEAIAQAFLNGETAPNYLLNGITSSAQFRMNYVKNTNPEFVSIANFNVWFNMNTGAATSAYIDLYTENSTRDWQKAQAEFALRSEEVLSELDELIPEGATDAMIVHIVHDYLVANTVYDEVQIQKDESDADLYDAYGALVLHRTACQGYSLAYMYILDHYGINCAVAVSGVQQHAWNLVEIEEEKTDNYGGKYTEKNWYHVDLSADDPFYDTLGQVSHKYLLLSTAELLAISPGRADFDVYSRDYNLVFTDNTCANAPFEGRAESIWATSNSACYYYRNADGGIDLYCLDSSNALHKNSGEGHYPPGENMTWVSFGSAYFYQVSRLSADFSGGKHILYYTAPTTIYSIDLDDQADWADDGDGDADDEPSMSLFYNAGAVNDPGLIFGLARVEGVLYYTYSTIPAAGDETWIPVPAEDTPSEKAVGTLFLSGGKIYSDAKHTKEVTVTGLSYSSAAGEWVLNGLDFSTAEAIGLYFEDEAVTLKLAEGSVNAIALNGKNAGTKTGLFAAGALTITGEGTLTVAVSGGSRRAYGIRLMGNLRVTEGATLTATALTDDPDGNSFGIMQWKEGSTAVFTDCSVEARGQRAAIRLGGKVTTKQDNYADMNLSGGTAADSAELTEATLGHMAIGTTGKYEEVTVGMIGSSPAKTFLIASKAYTYEAEVVNAGKTSFRKYRTFAAALKAAEPGDTILLLSDVILAETVEIPATADITLDLGGHTLTDGEYVLEIEYLLVNRGKLKIGDSSAEMKGCLCSHQSVIDNYGTLSMERGYLKGYTYCVYNEPDAAFTLAGGILTYSLYFYSSSLVYNKGSFTMTGGSLYDGAKAVYNAGGASFILKGGSITKNSALNAGVIQNYGTFRMEGGSITENSDALYTYSSETCLLGGEIRNNTGKAVFCGAACTSVTLGGDIVIEKKEYGYGLWLQSSATVQTRILISSEIPLTPKASVGVSFSDMTAGGALGTLPYRLVSSGLDPQARKAFYLETAISGARLRYENSGLVITKDTDILICLTSDCEGSTVAMLTGGGQVEKGASVTLTSTPREGFKFAGWYDGETELGKTETLTLTSVNDDIYAVARYEAVEDKEFTVVLKGGAYEARVPGTETVWSCERDRTLMASPAAQLTVAYTGEDRFVAWLDVGTGMIISREEEFTFGIVRNMEIRAYTVPG